MPDIPMSNRSNADLQAELERRNASELSRFSGELSTAQTSAIKSVEELQKRNADNLKKFVSELEASRAAAVKSVDELQKRVAAEHATMLQLQTELRAAKAMLDNSQVGVGFGAQPGAEIQASSQVARTSGQQQRSSSPVLRGTHNCAGLSAELMSLPAALPCTVPQKEVDKEKGLLVAAKEAAQAARKEAAEAAAAARTAELALRGQAGMETLKVSRQAMVQWRRADHKRQVARAHHRGRKWRRRTLLPRLPSRPAGWLLCETLPLHSAPGPAVPTGPGGRLRLDPGRRRGAGQAAQPG